MGYCAAVFAAGKQVTANSIIRNNLCIDNGRSPKLARRQGDLYISTWDGGRLDGVEIYGNTFVWTAPIDAPILQMDHADFTGTRPNVFRDNTILSTVPSMVHSSKDLTLTGNTWWHTGMGTSNWDYGGEVLRVAPGSSEKIVEPRIERLLPTPPSPTARAKVPPAIQRRGNHWLLAMFVDPASADDRGNAVWLKSAMAQYGDGNLDGAIICAGRCENLPHGWGLTGIQIVGGRGTGMVLVSPQGKVVAQWKGLRTSRRGWTCGALDVGGWRPPRRQ